MSIMSFEWDEIVEGYRGRRIRPTAKKVSEIVEAGDKLQEENRKKTSKLNAVKLIATAYLEGSRRPIAETYFKQILAVIGGSLEYWAVETPIGELKGDEKTCQ